MDDDTDRWLDALATTLPAHALLLRRLIDFAASDDRFRFVEVCCSIARGAGDELSDIDAGLGVADDAWPDALASLGPALARLGDAVEVIDHEIPEWGDRRHRRFFVQYRDGVQLDLVAFPASERTGLPRGSRAVYDPDGRLATPFVSAVQQASAEDVRRWVFGAWAALADLHKYVRRDSPWEALERLHEARTMAWRLLAVTQGLDYPVFGLTAVLDAPDPTVPDGFGRSVATLEPIALHEAGAELAGLLRELGASAAARTGARLPEAFIAYVGERLSR